MNEQNNDKKKRREKKTTEAATNLLLFLPLNSKPWNWNWWNSCSFGWFASFTHSYGMQKVLASFSLFHSVLHVHFIIQLFISVFRHLLLLLLLLIIIYSLVDFSIERVSIDWLWHLRCQSIQTFLYYGWVENCTLNGSVLRWDRLIFQLNTPRRCTNVIGSWMYKKNGSKLFACALLFLP